MADAVWLQAVISCILGPLIIGAFLSCVACGVVSTLAWVYFSRFPQDRLVYKLLVGSLTAIVIADTAVQGSFAFDWGVKSWGDFLDAMRMRWQFWVFLLLGVPIALVQCYFAWRLHMMKGASRIGLVAVIFIVIGALAGLGVVLAMGVFCATHEDWLSYGGLRPLLIAWVAVTAGVDLVITGGTVWFLAIKPKRNSSGLLQPDSRFIILARLAVKTNALSLVIQIVVLGLLFGQPSNYSYMAVSFIEGQVYVGTFIATLNARRTSIAAADFKPNCWAPWSSDPPGPPISSTLREVEEGRAGRAEVKFADLGGHLQREDSGAKEELSVYGRERPFLDCLQAGQDGAAGGGIQVQVTSTEETVETMLVKGDSRSSSERVE
ncbi:hypothetical protein JCM10207_003793 [Rhodosporidiobolus poonsookiae]